MVLVTEGPVTERLLYLYSAKKASVFIQQKYFIFSYVRDGILYLKATLTSDTFGEEFLTSGLLDYW